MIASNGEGADRVIAGRDAVGVIGVLERRSATRSSPPPEDGASRQDLRRPTPSEGCCIRRAISREELLAAYRFLCTMRTSLGYPRPPLSVIGLGAAGGREIAVFAAKAWPEVVATATLLVGPARAGVPADRTFREVGELRESARLVGEVTNRAIVPAYGPGPVARELVRCCVAHGLLAGCTDLVSVIRPWEQEQFGSMGFERLGPIRSSGGPIPEPVALARLDLLSLRAGVPTGPVAGLGATDAELYRLYVGGNPYRALVARWAAQVEEARSGISSAPRPPLHLPLPVGHEGPNPAPDISRVEVPVAACAGSAA